MKKNDSFHIGTHPKHFSFNSLNSNFPQFLWPLICSFCLFISSLVSQLHDEQMRGQRSCGKFELRELKLKCLGWVPTWKESFFGKNILDLSFLYENMQMKVHHQNRLGFLFMPYYKKQYWPKIVGPGKKGAKTNTFDPHFPSIWSLVQFYLISFTYKNAGKVYI